MSMACDRIFVKIENISVKQVKIGYLYMDFV